MKVLFHLFLLVAIGVSGQASKAPSKNVRSVVANVDTLTPYIKQPVVNSPATKYLDAVGFKSSDLWNAAFVYWCFNFYTGGNPLPKTGSGMEMWSRLSSVNRLTAATANSNPALIIPGNIFFKSDAGKEARVGIVISVSNGLLQTVEADTYVTLTRAIYSGKVILMQRKLSEIDIGFSNFGGNQYDNPKSANK